MPDSRRTNTVSNSIAILEAVADCGVGVTAKEIAQRLGIAPATTYRLLNSLVADEYLVRTADLRGFALGARLRGFAAAVNVPAVPTAARGLLDEFRASTRFAVHLMHFRPAAVQVLSEDPDHPIPGERELARHLHASAAGKLLLASRTEWRTLVAHPVRIAARTKVDHAALAGDLQAVRDTGYARAADELVPGVACLALPIYNGTGTLSGALCLTGPSNRLPALESHRDPARDCATHLGPLLY
ncbi:IclR family transcriptional regulator C-terminal domain-containing protein [Nocardia sp. CDC153]|uniref:IclR family transcriptional regulator n=1 Tax=Nocardia sp. CDC153 TaxID=3112167 RepID=UPI002DB62A72|nr:IclR family transcriptional regulator C-terminal domain-containing protein [Nocardia sp. CDC153]MEC3954025.1 IclR family transcriptional regulator C-terminal domain-containing protein [Nocardia sp. CDC153]